MKRNAYGDGQQERSITMMNKIMMKLRNMGIICMLGMLMAAVSI